MKPAARLSDTCAHGGKLAAGMPTVLIGGLPAAQIATPHVCPMQQPAPPPVFNIPHVGGPVALASFTVWTCMMPTARMGDLVPCVGPPDTIAQGCFTVLVGG